MSQTIHLVRHGEVENPTAIIYGRMPGFGLSERGERQARAVAERLKDVDVGALWSSPLQRAQDTARVIAAPHGIEITTDDRLIESDSSFEGVGRTAWAVLRNPLHWWRLRNPLRPSWGESFRDIQARMLAAIDAATAAAAGREIVIVSHQLPLVAARNALARRRRPPWLDYKTCSTGSVTTLMVEAGKVLESAYFVPPERSATQD